MSNSATTSQGVSAGQDVMKLSLSAGRERVLGEHKLESCKVAGVSFEGRQEQVSQLKTYQPCMMVREPSNPADPMAVAVQTLRGAQLGYIPRELTGNFVWDPTFGYIYSVGANEKGLYGALVAVRSSLPPAAIDALPAGLGQYTRLAMHLPRAAWARLCRETLDRAASRCEVSWASDEPPMVVEKWAVDDAAHVVRLRGLMALHPRLAALRRLPSTADAAQISEAAELLAEMNERWTVKDGQDYIALVQRLRKDREAGDWRLDLGWLARSGVQIPPKLNQLTVQEK